MSHRKIIAVLGVILIFTGVSMVLPLLCSLYYGDHDWFAFIISGLITLLAGLLAFKGGKLEGEIHYKEAFAVVSLSWILVSVFGSLPYLLAGTFSSFTDAFFETMSGFTTTGASIIKDIEALPHGVLFWRSLTQWLGGMGIIVLFVAVLSSLGMGGMQMFRAELPGLAAEKIRPRISETAKILWMTYFLLTIFETALLYLLGMPLFDAVCHTFGTLATGGFSTKNAGIGHYTNPLIHWVIILFMCFAGINFALYYLAVRGKTLKTFWRNSECRIYFLLLITAVLITVAVLYSATQAAWGETIRQACFQVVSVMTTTGFRAGDFVFWPLSGQIILIILVFIGGCSGSTSGSIKVGRVLILFKQSQLELQRAVHPKAVLNPKINGRIVSHEVTINVLTFFFLYIAITVFSTFFLSLLGFDLVTSFLTAATAITNLGPGLDGVGLPLDYSLISAAGKLYLAFLMMLGRLELYTALLIFSPSFWRK